jgi:tetratricopeptide (TPR) repeat protein
MQAANTLLELPHMLLKDDRPLRVFIAMPGDFGPGSKWNTQTLMEYLYEPVCQKLSERLSRPVLPPIIEKERRVGGVIYSTMYREAFEADVYIADLTHQNPNVCIELGVRLALRKGLTIVLSQDTSQIPFNVRSLRVVEYGTGPDGQVIAQIVDFIVNGIEAGEQHCDSPVREALDIIVDYREVWENLRYEAGVLSNNFLARANESENRDERKELLAKAVDANPFSVAARTAFSEELRRQNRHSEAIALIQDGLKWNHHEPVYWRELGLGYGGMENPQVDVLHQAVAALQKAVDLESTPGKRVEYLCNLGGACRRLGLREAPRIYDWETLEGARQHYAEALELDRFNLYAGLNIVRLDLLLAKRGLQGERPARERVETLKHLCAYEAACSPENYWARFDWADTQLFSGEIEAGLSTYREAIELVPRAHRPAVLRSPVSTLQGLRDAGPLGDALAAGVDQAIQILRTEMWASEKGGGES